MELMNKVKMAGTAVISIIFSWLGVLAVPVFILLGCNICDYWTGISAAGYRDPEDERPVKSYKSIRGITKKVCMYILVLIGGFMDILIDTTLARFITVSLPPVFAITVTCWLIFNEIISILENMDDMGVAVPPFLLPVMRKMKSQIEEAADHDDGQDPDHGPGYGNT